MRHQVGLEGGHIEGGAGAVHHGAEHAPDLGARAGPHQGVDRLGGAAPVLLSVVHSSAMNGLSLIQNTNYPHLIFSSASDSSLTSKSSPSVS